MTPQVMQRFRVIPTILDPNKFDVVDTQSPLNIERMHKQLLPKLPLPLVSAHARHITQEKAERICTHLRIAADEQSRLGRDLTQEEMDRITLHALDQAAAIGEQKPQLTFF